MAFEFQTVFPKNQMVLFSTSLHFLQNQSYWLNYFSNIKFNWNVFFWSQNWTNVQNSRVNLNVIAGNFLNSTLTNTAIFNLINSQLKIWSSPYILHQSNVNFVSTARANIAWEISKSYTSKTSPISNNKKHVTHNNNQLKKSLLLLIKNRLWSNQMNL